MALDTIDMPHALAERDQVKLAAETVDPAYHPEAPIPLTADKVYESDELRDELEEKNFLLISSHQQKGKHPFRQHCRRMRRYSRRWIFERMISWIE